MNILSMQGISTEQVINSQGQIGVVSQHEKLHQDIKTLLLTRKGSVLGNPEFGSNLYKYLFELSSEKNLALINKEVENVLLDNYNFITGAEINSRIDSTTLYLKIDYFTINTNLSTKLEYRIPLNTEGGIDYGNI